MHRLLWLLAACSVEGPDPEGPPADLATRFAFPVAPRGVIGDVIGVDHDGLRGDGLLGGLQCVNFNGDAFPACYDGHDGSDFLLVGGFEAMDAEVATVIAAADGVVVETADGNYDRCHASAATGDVDCDGFPMVANQVTLEHADGVRSLYWHLKKDSVAVVVGEEVGRGAELGLIGSSGRSSLPHLHFEVLDAEGVVVDPYAGPRSQAESWWCVQVGEDGLPGGCEGAVDTRRARLQRTP